MFMVMLILDDPTQWQAILDAWEKAGAPGVTVLPSTGLGRLRDKTGLSEDIPLMPSLSDFFQKEEDQHQTLLAIIRERRVVDQVIAATKDVIGDLNRPHTGILVVLPVLEAYGLDRYDE